MQPSEQRRNPRLPIQLSVSYAPIIRSYLTHASAAVTMNLSERGAFIHSKQYVGVGEVLNMILFLDRNESVQVKARVVHATGRPNGTYDIGVHFPNLTPEEESLLSLQLARAELDSRSS